MWEYSGYRLKNTHFITNGRELGRNSCGVVRNATIHLVMQKTAKSQFLHQFPLFNEIVSH